MWVVSDYDLSMVINKRSNLIRVSLTLDPVDVDLLDRLGRLEGQNRSAEIRSILEQFRPMLTATVEAFEAAHNQRLQLDEAMSSAALSQIEILMPEAQRLNDAYLGALSRLEGAAAAAEAAAAPEAPASNTGATSE